MSTSPDAAAARDTNDAFEELVLVATPRLRRVLVARYGVELGNDVCADALAYAWEHRDRIATMTNPLGYLYRVAQSSARRYRRWDRTPPLPSEVADEAGIGGSGLDLPRALTRLTPDQRVAVMLVHAYGWSYADAAAALDIPVSTLRNHLHRGMKRLRRALEHRHEH